MIKKFNIKRYETFFLAILIIVFIYGYAYLQIGYPKDVAKEVATAGSEYDQTVSIINEKTEILNYKIFNYPTYEITINFNYITKEGMPPKIESIYLVVSQDKLNFTFHTSVLLRQRQKGWYEEFLKNVYGDDYEAKSRELENPNKLVRKLLGEAFKTCFYESDNIINFRNSTNFRCFSVQDETLTKEQEEMLYSEFPTDNLTEIDNYIAPDLKNNLFSDVGESIVQRTLLYQDYSVSDYINLKDKSKENITYTVYKMPLQRDETLYVLFDDNTVGDELESFYYFNLMSIPLTDPKINSDLREDIINWFVDSNLTWLMENRKYNFIKINDKNCYSLINAENERIENIYCISEKENIVETNLFIVSCGEFMFCDKLNNDELKQEYYSFIEDY